MHNSYKTVKCWYTFIDVSVVKYKNAKQVICIIIRVPTGPKGDDY